MGVYQQSLQCKSKTDPLNAISYIILKMFHIKCLHIMTNQNCHTGKFFPPQSKTI